MSITPEIIWAILLLPLAAFGVIALLIRRLPGKAEPASYASIGAVGISFLLSCWLLASVWSEPSNQILVMGPSWMTLPSFSVSFDLLIDPLSAIMLVVVCAVSLLVQVYSRSYIHSDPSYRRYFAYISLFTAAMIGLLMSKSLLFTFMFWELVGLSSYLLIGFWFHRPSAIKAAKKAFLITRIGDVGFLAALLVLYTNVGTFDILGINHLATIGAIGGTTLVLASIGLFIGAIGKSGQFPLHTWLPDAMEGPTPVSALIHAATMVAAGVFLVGRMFPLFEATPNALTIVAVIGAFTAVFAGTIAVVMKDIKRVLAYSTISQLGLMFLGLALGGVWVGIFFLFNHAFFKALLFLGAGSINHATGTFDMREMGGLRKKMPYTFVCFLLAALSLAGIWPLAGFFSKEEVLAVALDTHPLLFACAIITTFLTAFYIFRVVFIVFFGKYRGKQALHESSKSIVFPMIILAALSVTSGWLNASGSFEKLFVHLASIHPTAPDRNIFEGIFGLLSHPLAWVSLAVASAGIFSAYALYVKKWVKSDRLKENLGTVYAIITRKYWLDELYEKVIATRLLYHGLFRLVHWFETKVVDGATHHIGSVASYSAKHTRRIQNGAPQLYIIVGIAGIIIIVVALITLL